MDPNLENLDGSKRKSQVGLWVVAGCLVVLLVVYNLWSVFAGGSEPQSAGVAATRMPTTKNAAVRKRLPISWPALAFDDLIKHNPFQYHSVRQSLRGLQKLRGTPEEQAELALVQGALEESREARREKELLAQQREAPSWNVSLLFQSENGTAAIIDNKLVEKGDEIDGYRIVAINSSGVTLEPIRNAGTASDDDR